MTIIFVCKKCHRPFFFWNYRKNKYAGPPEPSAVVVMFNGRCPYCGHPLSVPSIDDIIIRLREGKKNEGNV